MMSEPSSFSGLVLKEKIFLKNYKLIIMLKLTDFKEITIRNSELSRIMGGYKIVGSNTTADGTTKDLEFSNGDTVCDVEDGNVYLFD